MSAPTLLAFDFDGTLAPIREDPTDVRMHRAAAALLNEAADLPGVVVAVVSGRDADDLTLRAEVPGAYLVGSHGLEIRAPGGVHVRDMPPLLAEVEPALLLAIEVAGLRLETKKHGVALHWRGRDYAEVAPLAERFRDWGKAAALDVIEGRCVVEARRHGGGKEGALRWLVHAVGVTRVFYAGDDATDFGALRYASENGTALFLASSERQPPPGVRVVNSFRELFRLVRQEVLM